MGLLRILGIEGKDGKNNHIFIWLIFTILCASLPLIIRWFMWYMVCDTENKSYYGIKDLAFFALVINITNFYELVNKGLKLLNTDLMQKIFFFASSIILIILLCLMVGMLFYIEYKDQSGAPLYAARVWALIISACSMALSLNITCVYKEAFNK